MFKNSLDKLILDLDKIGKNFDNIFEVKYNNIMAQIFVLIGQTTAYDTGVSREIIKNILVDLGRPDLQGELEHTVYEFWKKKHQREIEGATYTFNKSNGKYSISIEDYGIFNQDEYGIVSDIHPRQDSNVIPHNIEKALDMVETDADKDIVLAFNQLEKEICYAIERGI